MKFPNEFKSFEDCQNFFSDKNAGIFHGEDKVVIRILSNNDRTEDKCVYAVNSDMSLKLKDSNVTNHKDADSSRRSGITQSDSVTVETVVQKQVVEPKQESKPTETKINKPKNR